MDIIPVDDQSPFMIPVKKLWRANSATLGFFPDDAFTEYAARKQIVVARDSEGNCVGYLLYRTSYMTITIVHLCVDAKNRHKGVARALVDYLKQITRKFNGIGMRCRRDYEANKVWPRLGFVALSDRPGRSRNGEPLTYWWFDHGHLSLFKFIDQQAMQSKTRVVIDSNIFFDLQDELRRDSEESKSLMADWLQDEVALCLTNEIFNDINNHPDRSQRKRGREFAQTFPVLSSQEDQVDYVSQRLQNLFRTRIKPRDESDIRHLAHAIASKAQFFVTRDKLLLKMADQAYDAFGLSIARPCDLVTRLDELIRQAEYQPARLAGSLVQISRVQSKQDSNITDEFVQTENRPDFQRRLHAYLSDPQKFEIRVIRDTDQRPLAVIAYARQELHVLEIPLLRVVQSPLATTLTNHLILRAIQTSSSEKRTILRVTDPCLSENIAHELQNSLFTWVDQHWVKFNLTGIETANALAEKLELVTGSSEQERTYLHRLSQIIAKASEERDTRLLLDIERSLWPTKITDIEIPVFVVPIRPEWAMHLFDERMAKQTLFGAKPEIAMNCENVYYRARRPSVLSAPGRILWYVSSNSKYQGSQHVRACSCLDEVIVGKPKNLFRQFRRLGIYEWKDVLNVAKGNADNEIMAVRFSDTELFSRPISWNDFQQTLFRLESHKSQIQSPIRISTETFVQIYKLGTQAQMES